MPTPPDYMPSAQNVADILRARTRGPSGAEIGTFTSETVPNEEQVDGLIDTAAPFVMGALGAIPPGSPCSDGARSLWALKAAELVEISYFPEQLAPGGTVSALRALYADLLEGVQACLSGGGGGGDDGDATPAESCFYDLAGAEPAGFGGVPPYGRFIDGLTPVEIVTRVIDSSQL